MNLIISIAVIAFACFYLFMLYDNNGVRIQHHRIEYLMLLTACVPTANIMTLLWLFTCYTYCVLENDGCVRLGTVKRIITPKWEFEKLKQFGKFLWQKI